VIRNPKLSHQERFGKAILSSTWSFHYCDLSFVPPEDDISQRFRSSTPQTVTITENCTWPGILNSEIDFVQFVIDGKEHWSFSRLGTHCLENFFGLGRQNSYGDDRLEPSLRIIARATMVYQMMHDLGIAVKNSRHDNVVSNHV
jgi:hypothetical protein